MDDLLNNLVQNLAAKQQAQEQAKKAQELINLRKEVENLANNVVSGINYKAVETKKGVISTEQIEKSLMNLVKTIFENEASNRYFLQNLQTNLQDIENLQRSSLDKSFSSRLCHRLVYVFQQNYDYVKKNYKFNLQSMETLIAVADFRYSNLSEESKKDTRFEVNKQKLRLLEDISIE